MSQNFNDPGETPASDPGARVPNSVRAATMRRRLIDATVVCLEQYGYARTTLQKVTDQADVSRGAFLHHFATRADLIHAVALDAAEQQNIFVREFMGKGSNDAEVFELITEATWRAMQQPAAIALLEIMIGVRTDPDLEKRFSDHLLEIQHKQQEDVWLLAKSLGAKDKGSVLAMVHLHRSAMRGLLLELLCFGVRETAERSMILLKYYKEQLTQQLVTGKIVK